jgi:hypothetical protein
MIRAPVETLAEAVALALFASCIMVWAIAFA